MKGYSRIIDKIELISMMSGAYILLDTKGLNCVIKPSGGGIGISLSEDSMTFPLNDGEEFEFCGKIYLSSAMSPSVYAIYYHTL